MNKQLLLVTALLFALSDVCAQETSSLQKLKRASQDFNKKLKRYAHCLTKTKPCSEKDKKALKRAAQTMGALLATYGLIGAALTAGAVIEKGMKKQPRKKEESTPQASKKEATTLPWPYNLYIPQSKN